MGRAYLQRLVTNYDFVYTLGDDTMTINVVLNPEHEKNRRFVQNTINKYHEYLKTFDTDYRIIRDDDGDICAIVARYHAVFKDGSDMVMELNSIPETIRNIN